MKKSLPLLAVVLGLGYSLLQSGCDVINPSEDIPAYIQIDTFHLTTNLSNEGFASHKITDAWVFVNDVPYGAFELPVTVPVFEKGESDIVIRAGIKDNGISSTRAIYPAYRAYETTAELIEGETITVLPEVAYFSNTTFAFIERFESGNGFTSSSVSQATMEPVNDPSLVFEGGRSSGVHLTEVESFFEAGSGNYQLPGSGRPVYLEIDYRCDNPFDIWIKANFNGGTDAVNTYLLTVSPKDSWSKIYVQLSDIVGLISSADDFEIFILANKLPDLTEATLYFDNIKLLYL